MRGEDQLSRLIYDFCGLLFTAAGSPAHRRPPQVSPSGFASLLLGASVALMLCGSVTLLIGFILMPWVFVFYTVGFLSNLSVLGRAILYPAGSTSPKDVSSGFMF